MAIIKKYNPKKIYLSARVKKKLSSIYDYPVTIVEAPIGYGKTTIVKEFLKSDDGNLIWFNIDSSDREQFITALSSRISCISDTLGDALLNIGYPTNMNDASRIVNEIINTSIDEHILLVLDNFQYVFDEFLLNIMKDLSGSGARNFTLVCLTQEISSRRDFDLSIYNINYIGKEDLALSKGEVDEYFRRCGVKLEETEIDTLFKHTEGWISALYLQLLNLEKNKVFINSDDADNLVLKAIWNNLTKSEQYFLIGMSVFPDFTARQAAVFSSDYITDDERDRLLENNGFIVYDPIEKKYRVHAMLKAYVENEFSMLEPRFKKIVYRRAGDWYASNNDVYTAMHYYKRIEDYESIFAMDWSKVNISDKLKRMNKDMFMELILNSSYDVKKKYVKNYIIFVYSLFALNERDFFKRECDFIREYVNTETEMTQWEKNEILGEVEFLNAFGFFNNIKEMSSHYKKAFEYLKSPSKLFRGSIIFNFECPSILGLFHSGPGQLESELADMEEMMPNYYRLTEGDFKGMEVLMRAEARYHQGNMREAELLCEKAKYMAETRQQTNVYISALHLQARIAIYFADYGKVNEFVGDIRRFASKEKRFMLNNMSDMCQSYIYASIDEEDNIISWLKDSGTIENRASILNLGYANIIYCKYLLLKDDYNRIIAIGDQMLNVAYIFTNVMYIIYINIYMSIAYYKNENTEYAVNHLIAAMEYAYMDGLIMPFVELYDHISSVLDRILLQKDNNKYNDFIDGIKAIAKRYHRSIYSVKKAVRTDKSYGLTKRELDVAKLAAQRMSNKEIADMLFIAESTVKSNMKIIFSKLGINSRSELKDFFS